MAGGGFRHSSRTPEHGRYQTSLKGSSSQVQEGLSPGGGGGPVWTSKAQSNPHQPSAQDAGPALPAASGSGSKQRLTSSTSRAQRPAYLALSPPCHLAQVTSVERRENNEPF